jgi:hypothetical protein
MKDGSIQKGTTLDASVIRRLAVKARVDPRTIQRILDGQEVRGDARHRAVEVLEAEGLMPDKEVT